MKRPTYEWKYSEVEIQPEDAMAFLKHHRLMPDAISEAVSACAHLARCKVVEFTANDHLAGRMFVGSDDGVGVASLDLIPVPEYYRSVPEFEEAIRSAVAEFLAPLFENGTRRVTAIVPISRNRTKKALRVAGFEHEGRMKDAVLLHHKPDEPEDAWVMGMTRSRFSEEYGNGAV